MFNFLPRDEKYFEQFTQMARRIHESARTLDRFFIGETTVSAAADHIKRLEHECDEISHEILRGIDRTFITPIDREDIHQLAVRLDDVIDLVDGTIRRVVLFKIIEPTDLSKRLSAIVVQATSELVDAVADLRKQKGVVEHCIRIKQYENEGDVAYHEAVASLFTGSIEAIEVIKWKDIYDNLERTIDQCAAVAQMLESVILKHS
jgi:predicted phosphate transport protein (TIGR00153 family)